MHILGNKMIVAFGNTAKHDFDTRFASADDVWIFDLKTTLWQRVAGHGTPAPKAKNKEKQNAPAPRSGHASVLDGSNLLVFGGAVSHGQSAATSAELWSLPLGPPAPPSLPTITDISPDGFTAIWDDLYFEHTSKGYVLSYRMEDEAMEEGWGEWSQVHVPRGNEPRHSHRLDNLKFNTAYEFNLTAVGESGDSTWWGPLETREVWTQGWYWPAATKPFDSF